MEEVLTPYGSIEVLYQLTLGDIAIVTLLALILLFLILQWLLDTIWKGVGR
ncbi:hypothetical protein [Paenibacillus agricola]|uniref:Uncharacterized protein n=1 Tax=Paenibacillus agricola TaxID=2716264 RepID=A0ABX0JJ70_9BACL|nr:hypothetical protein [Paenibacillus agricola]NHN35545.1 hypothetical protein [Paenibacillus agricola]